MNGATPESPDCSPCHAHERASERGSAMLMALCLTLVVGALVTSILHGVRRLGQDASLERAHATALHAADGGLALASASLGADPSWRGATVQIGAAEVRVQVTRDAAHPSLVVTATATVWPNGELGLPVRTRLAADYAPAERGRLANWRALD